MYAKHFNLEGEPFSLTPDPFFLYRSPGHSEALAALEVGLLGRRGLLTMIGEVGTGKTTLLYSLLSEIAGHVRTAYVSNTRLSFEDIVRQVLRDFGVPFQDGTKADLLAALNGFLMTCAASGTTAAVVIDEAQNLDDDTFENLRLLSNFETFATKLLQIVLVGQPELEARLSQRNVRQIAERVAVRTIINPLSWKEGRLYIEHRLRQVGGSIDLFTPAALGLVLLASRGLPRRINILCHNAMLFAFGRGESEVTFRAVYAAVREKRGRGLATRRGWISRLPRLRSLAGAFEWRRLRPLFATMTLAIAVGGFAGMRWISSTEPPEFTAATAASQYRLQLEKSIPATREARASAPSTHGTSISSSGRARQRTAILGLEVESAYQREGATEISG